MTDDVQRTPLDRARFDVHPDVDPTFVARSLTPRMRRMVEAYVREGTYAAAARASGFAVPTVKKYIETDERARAAIQALVDQAAMLSGVTLERVLEEYGRIAFANVADLIDVMGAAGDLQGALDELADLPREITAAISEVTIDSNTDQEGVTTGKMKLKMVDKKSALSDLGRVLSIFNDKLTIEDKSGFGDRLERAIASIEAYDARLAAADGGPSDEEAE